MTNKFYKSVLVVVVMLMTTAAQAEPRGNMTEMQLSAGFFHGQNSDNGLVSGDVVLGRYLADPHWQLGLEQGLDWAIRDEQDDLWKATSLGFVAYHFGLTDRRDDRERDRDREMRNPIIPFSGGVIGGVYNDDDGTGVLGPLAGIKWFVNETTFVLLKYRYEWYWSELDLSDGEESDGSHVASLGIGFIW